jgi:hypothetical protein
VPNIPAITAVDIDEDWGVRKTNSAVAGASHFGFYPDIRFVHLDVFDVDKMAELLSRLKPAIVYNSATLQSWWVITQLPPDAYKAIDEARFAPWFPMHFLPAYNLMLAVRKSGIKTHVVNAAFPDLVNPVLARLGLSPTAGVGNIDNVVCTLKVVLAKMRNTSLRSVGIYMVAPHFVSYYLTRYGNTGGAPYYLKVMIDDRDVTSQLDMNEVLTNVITLGKRPGGARAHPVVASSVCRIIMGILFDTREISHAPGPNGLPGGYPVRLSSAGVEVFLPDGLTLEEAVRINNEAQVLEGVQSVEEDGTVIITEKSAEVFRKLLDYDCRSYTVENCQEKCRELREKFQRYVSKIKRD